MAVRATYYVSLHVHDPVLREVVVDHVATAWALCIQHGGHPDGFKGFFADYRRDVEVDTDPALRRGGDQPWEYRRVWTNHAAMLHGEPELVCRRLIPPSRPPAR